MRASVDNSVVRFAAVGLSNTVLGLVVIYAAKLFLKLDDVVANLTGYIAGILVSFALNKRWTFRHAGGSIAAFSRFVAVLAAAYVSNIVSVLAAIDAGVDAYIAQALGAIPYAVVSYAGMRYYAFAR